MQEFGVAVAVVSGAVLAALVFRRVAERVRMPAPVVFLLAAAVASDLYEPLGTALSPDRCQLDRVGCADRDPVRRWRRRLGGVVSVPAVGAVATLGFGATLVTAGVMAVAAHVLFGFGWATSAVLGVALAPTDPAVVFSVIGEGRLAERPKTILEAESGANDPIAIALMIGVLAAIDGGSWLPTVTTTLARQLAIGLAVGVAGAWLTRKPLKHLTEPRETLQPIVALSAAGLIFGTATAIHGSGFLAVFVAGLLLGDANTTVGEDVRAFHSELAGLAEVVVFVSLGLTVHLAALGASGFLQGLALTVVLLTRRPAARSNGAARPVSRAGR